MRPKWPWHYASLLTVPSLIVVGYLLYLYIFKYDMLSEAEDWGILAIRVLLFCSVSIFIAGLLIRHLITNLRTRNLIEGVVFVLLVLYISSLN